MPLLALTKTLCYKEEKGCVCRQLKGRLGYGFEVRGWVNANMQVRVSAVQETCKT